MCIRDSEMPGESLTTRLLASHAKINQQKVRSASLNDEELKDSSNSKANGSSTLSDYEKTDMTVGAQELACAAGFCEIQ